MITNQELNIITTKLQAMVDDCKKVAASHHVPSTKIEVLAFAIEELAGVVESIARRVTNKDSY